MPKATGQEVHPTPPVFGSLRRRILPPVKGRESLAEKAMPEGPPAGLAEGDGGGGGRDPVPRIASEGSHAVAPRPGWGRIGTLRAMRFGLLLPHFGEHANAETVLGGAKLAERLGFDAVITRDHVVYEPHSGIENEDTTFWDIVTTMAMVAATTEHITIGTAALIPYRHPILLAREIGTLVAAAGDRILLGLGTGRFEREFEAVGLGGIDRVQMLTETIDILRAFGTGEPVTYASDIFEFSEVTVLPAPADVPIWWCSGTPKSARIASGGWTWASVGCRAVSRSTPSAYADR